MSQFSNAPELEGQQTESSIDGEEEISRIRDLAKSLDISDGRVLIHRQAPGRSEYDYEGEMPIDTFSLEELKRLYGGGKYTLKLATRTGKYVRTLRTSVHPRHIGEIYKEPEKPVTPVAGQPQGSNDFLMMMLANAKEQALATREMAERQAAQAQAQQQLLLTMMLQNQKSSTEVLVAALTGKSPTTPAGGNIIELLTPLLIENMKPRGGIAETVATVKALRELNDSPSAPPEPKEEDMLDKVAKLASVVGPAIGAFMASRNPQQPPQAPQAPQQPIPVGPPQPDPQYIETNRRVEHLLGQLRFATPLLLKAAKENKDVTEIAPMLDSFLDDVEFEMLCQILERPTWITDLFGNTPGVVENGAWFESLRDVILNPGPDDEEASAEAPATPATPQVPGATGSPV